MRHTVARLTPSRKLILAGLVALLVAGLLASLLILDDDREPARFAYIDAEERDVWVTDTDLTNRRKLFDSGPLQAYDLSWSPRGTHVSFTTTTELITDEPRILYVATADGEIVHHVQESSFVAWSPDGEMFALHRVDEPQEYAADSVVDIRDLNGRAVCEFEVLSPGRGNFSADGRQFVHTAHSDGFGSERELRVRDLATCSTHRVEALDDYSKCYEPVFSPEDPFLIACGDLLFDLSGGARRELPGNFVKWSPDGRQVVLAQHGPRQPPGQCALDICTVPEGDCPPAKVYDVARTTESFEIAMAGGGVLTDCVFEAGNLSGWSPDSERLVLSPVSRDGAARSLQIWSIDAQTAETISIPENEEWTGAFYPEFSPEGDRVLFRTSDRGPGAWFMADVEALTLERVPGIEAPVWQPDRRQ